MEPMGSRVEMRRARPPAVLLQGELLFQGEDTGLYIFHKKADGRCPEQHPEKKGLSQKSQLLSFWKKNRSVESKRYPETCTTRKGFGGVFLVPMPKNNSPQGKSDGIKTGGSRRKRKSISASLQRPDPPTLTRTMQGVSTT